MAWASRPSNAWLGQSCPSTAWLGQSCPSPCTDTTVRATCTGKMPVPRKVWLGQSCPSPCTDTAVRATCTGKMPVPRRGTGISDARRSFTEGLTESAVAAPYGTTASRR
ncbi:MAG: hypothetical protein NZ556_04145, partial [Fimbriimonadales bacterium]|nr:hypothetical protein [Fimbriimonadales bacterium]